ncbi:signal peptidase I [Candidatus Parcubacteria bacterium]|nr:signal peptidase I [Candidatus Parcubacteria bacterium]
MKLFKIIYYIIIAFIAVIAILLIVSIFPITGNYKVMLVQSGSMEPAIKLGSVIVVKPVDSYEIGDVITFSNPKKPGETITHRIYDMKAQEGKPIYITKGDANNAPDQREIPEIEVVGKVLFNIPYLGYMVDFAKKPIGFALIIIVPAVIIIFDEIKNIFKELKKRK